MGPPSRFPAQRPDDGPPSEILRELGRGGMGRVDLVFDPRRGTQVAKKRILVPDPEALLRFKLEFRAIERWRHPNLVELYELGEDDDGLYFLMEAVEGVDFRTHCHARRSTSDSSGTAGEGVVDGTEGTAQESSVDVARFRDAAGQVLRALSFLHSHGIAHGDLKPSNILVRTDGRVKVLDFGILSTFGRREDPGQGQLRGTPGYMAPELFQGARPSAETDRFALGVLFIEVLTGRRPHVDGPPGEERWTTEPKAEKGALPTNVGLGLPDRLEPVLAGLLASPASHRPTLKEVARALGDEGPWSAPTLVDSPDRTLVGRDHEVQYLLDALDDCYGGAFRAVVLEGPSGVGKTALAEEVEGIARRGGALVLHGRGRLRERMAFGGLDEAVDTFAQYLAANRSSLGPKQREAIVAAAALFPTLNVVVPELAAKPPLARGERLHAFDALAQLLSSEALRRGALVLVLDDLQWFDGDGIAWCSDLLARRPSRVFLLSTRRNDGTGVESLEPLLATEGLEHRAVGPLPNEALQEILERVCEDHGTRISKEGSARLVELSQGRPILVELGVRALWGSASDDTDPTQALARRLSSLESFPKAVMATLLASGGVTDLLRLGAVMKEPPGKVQDTLIDMERLGVLRITGKAQEGGGVDFYHDMVRASARRAVPQGDVERAHGAWANHWMEHPEGMAVPIIHHLLSARRDEEAAERAADAAYRALDGFAYGLAAQLFTVALSAPKAPTMDLLRGRAKAYELSGRYEEAARDYALLSQLSRGADADEALLAEASSLLAAGIVGEGRDKLTAFLKRRGEYLGGPFQRMRAGLRFLWGPTAEPRVEGRKGGAGVRDAGVDERAAIRLSFVDPLAGVAYMQRAQGRFLRAGEYVQAGLIDFALAYWASFRSDREGPVPLAEAYERSAFARLRRAQGPLPGWAHGAPPFLEGVRLQRQARKKEAAAAYESALRILEAHGNEGTFEYMLVLCHRSALPLLSGPVDELKAAIRNWKKAGQGRMESVYSCFVETFTWWAAVLEGRMEEGRERALAYLGTWSDEGTYQRSYAATYAAVVARYTGDPKEEVARLEEALRRDTAFRFTRNMYSGYFCGQIALLFARALRAGVPSVGYATVARWASRSAKAPPIGRSSGLRALGYAQEASGAAPAAVDALLRRAEETALREGDAADRAVALFQRGLRTSGSPGDELRREALEEAVRLGVHERFLWDGFEDVPVRGRT